MNQYKIYVYAICKNEEKFVERWLHSMSEADGIFVLDTGSEDGTVSKLRAGGATVHQQIFSPWRFDTARNVSLSYVPEDADLCVCTDLDEVFHPGWRALLERAYTPEIQQVRYRYTWNFTETGAEGYVFWIDKIHRRQNFRWVNPVHEVLEYTGTAPQVIRPVPGIQVDHLADPTKSRGSYLPLLELAVQENPDNDRNMHYLGREYMYYEQWDACIATLERHLSMPSATWRDERCASMRYIGRAWAAKGDSGKAKSWFLRAIAEAPHLREPYIDAAKFLSTCKEWDGVVYFTQAALAITSRPESYISEAESWGALPYDLLSLGMFYTGRYAQAMEAVNRALSFTPEDQRLKDNAALMAARLE